MPAATVVSRSSALEFARWRNIAQDARNVTPALDPTQLSPLAQKLLAPDAPPKALALAAKGVIMGAKPTDVVSVVAMLTRHADPELAQTAKTSLAKLPTAVLDGALEGNLQGFVLDVVLDALPHEPALIERVLRQTQLSGATLAELAAAATEAVGELIATNEQLLLLHPKAIEKLYLNKRVRMSTADRVLELAVRNGVELEIPAYRQAAQAILNELIIEPTEEPTFDDVLFRETDEIAEQTVAAVSDEDTHEEDDEGEERVKTKFLPLHQQLQQMTISQKIRRALLGTSADRMLLVRDTNKLVCSAAASAPQFTDTEAALVAANRNVHDDVLRIIAMNRNFTRNYQVKFNLVTNPKTPLTFSARLLPHLRDSDLRALTKSKNVPSSIQSAARQQLERKENKGKK
jgi:hypothetical protein